MELLEREAVMEGTLEGNLEEGMNLALTQDDLDVRAEQGEYDDENEEGVLVIAE